jgi:hypothetical protein
VPRGVVEGRGAVAQEQRSAVWRASRGGRMGSGPRRGKRVLGPVQNEQSNFLFIKYIFYQFKFQMLQRMSSHGRKFSNKMWICMELNKEQLSLLELSKI